MWVRDVSWMSVRDEILRVDRLFYGQAGVITHSQWTLRCTFSPYRKNKTRKFIHLILGQVICRNVKFEDRGCAA